MAERAFFDTRGDEQQQYLCALDIFYQSEQSSTLRANTTATVSGSSGALLLLSVEK